MLEGICQAVLLLNIAVSNWLTMHYPKVGQCMSKCPYIEELCLQFVIIDSVSNGLKRLESALPQIKVYENDAIEYAFSSNFVCQNCSPFVTNCV